MSDDTLDPASGVSVTISSVAVDYNDRVSAGEELSCLDTARLATQVL